MNNVHPIDLKRQARAIASSYDDKGAIIISVGDEGIRIGTEGLTPDELRQALCVAINYSFVFQEN